MGTDSDIIKELAETKERAKSNSHRLDNVEEDIKELRTENKAIYELAASIKALVTGQESLSTKVDNLSDKVDKNNKETKEDIDGKISAVNAKINKIDEEGKFNIRTFIKDNWVAILAALYILIDSGKSFIK